MADTSTRTDQPGSPQPGSPLPDWRGCPLPGRTVLDGAYARLEPLDPARHGPALLASAQAGGAENFRFLADHLPADAAAFQPWLDQAAASADPLFSAVVDRRTGQAEGRQSLMRIDAANGVIEVGHILWGPRIARTRVATEALFLAARHAFDGLGYRRLEWKCNSLNAPSRRAAARFGFTYEGEFRQHMVVKGRSRDTTWFAMLDHEWPHLRAGYEAWLAPGNFDADGQQRSPLRFAPA